MKAVHLRVGLRSALAVFLAVAAGQAQAGTHRARAKTDGARVDRVRAAPGAFERKFEYCTTCHGISAQGFRGYYNIPRLAGQQTEYIENQLHAFLELRRLNPVMANVAHGITPEMIPFLANRMHSLNPPPYGGAPREDIALGKEIFANGLPNEDIPACSACHGPGAMGQRQIPRLAGQLYWYMTYTLSIWSKERGQGGRKDMSWIMRPTVENLSPKEVRAVAAYVSTLK